MKKTLYLPKFDASLNTDWCNSKTNADLTLTLRLGFRQINPAGGAAKGSYNDYGDASGQPRAILKWTPQTWQAWKLTFCRSAQLFWHGKFWISNNRGLYPVRLAQHIFLPNFYCKFEILGSDASAGRHHHVIDVVRLDPSESWFGSHSTLYDSGDINSVPKARDSKGNTVMQRAHVHEIGHLLGLPHVDVGKPHCPPGGNTNASACYGITDTDMNSVMGSGMRLDVAHARPWIEAMDAFAKGEARSPYYNPAPKFVKPFQATKQRIYPRSTAEFEAGKLVTTLQFGR